MAVQIQLLTDLIDRVTSVLLPVMVVKPSWQAEESDCSLRTLPNIAFIGAIDTTTWRDISDTFTSLRKDSLP